MSFYLSRRSNKRLELVHPHLAGVVREAILISDIDFAVLETARTEQDQKRMVESGASTTMHSRHLVTFCEDLGRNVCHAVDLGAYLDGRIRWDWPLYHKIADAMNKAADELDVPIEWGGDWKSFPDGPHFQLPWSIYP